MERESKVEVDALIREIEQVQKALEDAKLKLVEMESLQANLDKLNTKVIGLETEVDELKTKVSEVKEVGIIEFKESDAYKLVLNTVVAQFFTKTRLKMMQILGKNHQIEDLSCLDGIANKPIFFGTDDDEKERDGEKVS